MAEAGLFIGWGQPVRGRETTGIGVFNEAIGFHGKQQEGGEIEGFEVVLLGLHGGDLYGFILVKGSEDQIAAVRANDEFQRLITRAAQVVERVGVVDASVDEGVGQSVAMYQDAVKDLA